ncbi:MAG: nuclear transport factor 2 family protein [Sphingopyxis sp.]|uniref:nuclear transport factor 2 family protein n=1 Tax=Sphingopyxis sp. TaxID=1908224 RepID=UPI002ABC9B0B|nr:nuclear transport factor 2 family protein [Sphingopyxis sp.]MDZ3832726.1 nuclear transport factor 2 family protein [Sphingopyxis sp.]
MASATAALEGITTENLFDRYHASWEAKDPDQIAALHSKDSVFCLHDGSPVVTGRDPLRDHCRQMFQTYEFSMEMGRRLYADDHWVFEWMMILPLVEPDGTAFTARIKMLDVVTVDADGLVSRKDIYPDSLGMAEAFSRAGIVR